jgi:antitoxin MazE
MTTLIRIGNSQGVRIPKPIIKQANLENSEIEFEITQDGLLLKPIKKNIRRNWEENIKNTLSNNKNIKDEGLLEDLLDEELDSWEW